MRAVSRQFTAVNLPIDFDRTTTDISQVERVIPDGYQFGRFYLYPSQRLDRQSMPPIIDG